MAAGRLRFFQAGDPSATHRVCGALRVRHTSRLLSLGAHMRRVDIKDDAEVTRLNPGVAHEKAHLGMAVYDGIGKALSAAGRSPGK